MISWSETSRAEELIEEFRDKLVRWTRELDGMIEATKTHQFRNHIDPLQDDDMFPGQENEEYFRRQ